MPRRARTVACGPVVSMAPMVSVAPMVGGDQGLAQPNDEFHHFYSLKTQPVSQWPGIPIICDDIEMARYAEVCSTSLWGWEALRMSSFITFSCSKRIFFHSGSGFQAYAMILKWHRVWWLAASDFQGYEARARTFCEIL